MSEIATSEAQMPMGLDTVRFKTPYMNRSIVDRIKAQGESYCRICNETGECVWEITRTNRRPIVARKYAEKMLGCGASEDNTYRPNFAALQRM